MAKAQEMCLKLTLIIESAHLYSTFLSFLLSLSPIFHSTQLTLPSAVVLKHQPRFWALLMVSYIILKVQMHPPLPKSFPLLETSFPFLSSPPLWLFNRYVVITERSISYTHGDMGSSINTSISPGLLQLGLQWSPPCWFSEASASTGSHPASHQRTSPIQYLF